MKRRLPLTLPDLGSTYPYDIDGRCELHAVEAVSLGRGIMDLRRLGSDTIRPTFINDVVRMVRPNDAAAWLPAMREHYTMDAEGRGALIAEAKQAPRTTEEDLAWVDSLERGPYTPMGPVCHNGEDLARAFPQVPNDLSRDLYATIGDPVPPLVWPRQESEQSPTCIEVSNSGPPAHTFKVGDHVYFARRAGRECDHECAPPIGWVGVITEDDKSGIPLRVIGEPWEGFRFAPAWWFAPEALALENACREVPSPMSTSYEEAGEWAGSVHAVEATPAKPHAYKVGDKVKVARAVMRDSAGHWCFWTGALEMTIGCTGEVLALVPNETAGAYLYIRVDGHEFYYSPEALDLVTAAE